MDERPVVQGTITQDHTKGARLVDEDPFQSALTSCSRAIGGRQAAILVFAPQEEESDPINGRIGRPPPDLPPGRRACVRGEADLAGLYWAHHSTDKRRRPLDTWQTLALAALERVRVEALGANLPGIAHNLAAALLDRLLKPRYASGVSAPVRAEALAMLVRERIAPRVVPQRRISFVERYRPSLSKAVAANADRLLARLSDQEAYAQAALDLAAAIPAADAIAHITRGAAQDGVEAKGDSDPGPVQGNTRSEGEAAGLKSATEEAISDAPLYGTPEKTDARGGNDGAPAEKVEDEGLESGRHRARRGPAPGAAYRIFTTAYDRVVSARTLWGEINGARAAQAVPQDAPKERRQEIARLAGRLRKALMAQLPRAWERDLLDGELDPSVITRIVANPTSGRFFRQRQDTAFNDTVVTLLLDNSSSMRGEPLRIAALAAEMVARAIESCGVRAEVLGYTTQNWRGGRARQAWMDAAQPADPGRVSELLHVVYKRADENIRGLRGNLATMGLKGLHKENVDGEALQWACGRLLARPERRRILVVVSDGAPSEETTLSLSHAIGNCLETHLRTVIAEIGRRGLVELFAIGIDYEVGKLYPDSVRIDTAEEIARALVDALPRLIAKAETRRRRTTR